MKRIKNGLLILLSSLLLFSTVSYAEDYGQYQATIFYLKEYYPYHKINTQMIHQIENSTPTALLELFEQENIHIYITESSKKNEIKKDAGGFFNGQCNPASYRYDKTKKITHIGNPISIYVYSKDVDINPYLHECGHALDYLAEYVTGEYKGETPISNSQEWEALYTQYATTLATFDSASKVNVPANKTEAFAEAFRIYIKYPGLLKDSCPEIYSFIEKQIEFYTSFKGKQNGNS